MLKSLGGRIREIRKSHGMTQEGLGERAGLNPNYVGYVERGEKNMTVKNILAISSALDVPVAELFSAVKVAGARRPAEGAGTAAREATNGYALRPGKKELLKEMTGILARMSRERLDAFYVMVKLIEADRP